MTYHESSSGGISIITHWAESHSSIRLVLLTSTRAVPGAALDALSDYDVILVVRRVAPYAAERAWVNAFGEVLVAYWDPLQPDPHYRMNTTGNVIQYTSGLKIDFTVWSVGMFKKIAAAPALPDELDAGYRVLLDKDSLAAGLLPPSGKAYITKPPTLQEYQTWVNDFLSDPPYVAKCLLRDELFPARWCLESDMQLVYLRRMLEWQVGATLQSSVPVGALGKGLKKRLPPDLWAEVENSFAGADRQANWQALYRTMAIFRRSALEVGRSLGYAYPDDLHQRVLAYVQRLQEMEI